MLQEPRARSDRGNKAAFPNKAELCSYEDARIILSLRLLIARAANKDSLAWWDDESLTPHAGFVLERLFPMAPPLAARSLALSAALARHQAACAPHDGALHLYRLDPDNQDKLALRFAPLLPIPMPDEPITTIDTLRGLLLNLAGESVRYVVLRRTNTHGLQIEIPPGALGTSPMLHRAKTLAWAYLEGEPGQPVFPFCMASPKGS
jgi:hypothetical protein